MGSGPCSASNFPFALTGQRWETSLLLGISLGLTSSALIGQHCCDTLFKHYKPRAWIAFWFLTPVLVFVSGFHQLVWIHLTSEHGLLLLLPSAQFLAWILDHATDCCLPWHMPGLCLHYCLVLALTIDTLYSASSLPQGQTPYQHTALVFTYTTSPIHFTWYTNSFLSCWESFQSCKK